MLAGIDGVEAETEARLGELEEYARSKGIQIAVKWTVDCHWVAKSSGTTDNTAP